MGNGSHPDDTVVFRRSGGAHPNLIAFQQSHMWITYQTTITRFTYHHGGFELTISQFLRHSDTGEYYIYYQISGILSQIYLIYRMCQKKVPHEKTIFFKI